MGCCGSANKTLLDAPVKGGLKKPIGSNDKEPWK
jgi:hypothetical protein